MDYEVPEEYEFFDHGFGISDESASDEAMYSYIYKYDDCQNLIFTHSPFDGNSLSVKLIKGENEVFYLYQEGVSRIVFQAWYNEKIIRVSFGSGRNKELRISYLPEPKLHFSEF